MYRQTNEMVYKSENITSPSISFDTEIQLGNPKHQCQSLGICKIEPSLYKKAPLINVNKKNSINTKVVFERNHFTFFFKKYKMSKFIQQKFFGGKSFIVLSAIEIPSFISEKLKISYTINVGKYPITESKDFYKVIF